MPTVLLIRQEHGQIKNTPLPGHVCVPLAGGEVSGAGLSVPGAVGVPGQTALSTVVSVELTPLQPQLDHAELTGHVQLFLKGTMSKRKI